MRLTLWFWVIKYCALGPLLIIKIARQKEMQKEDNSRQTAVNIKSPHMYWQSFIIFSILKLVCDCRIFVTLFRIFQYICADCIYFNNRLNFAQALTCQLKDMPSIFIV